VEKRNNRCRKQGKTCIERNVEKINNVFSGKLSEARGSNLISNTCIKRNLPEMEKFRSLVVPF
jgi:hypothetical protein